MSKVYVVVKDDYKGGTRGGHEWDVNSWVEGVRKSQEEAEALQEELYGDDLNADNELSYAIRIEEHELP